MEDFANVLRRIQTKTPLSPTGDIQPGRFILHSMKKIPLRATLDSQSPPNNLQPARHHTERTVKIRPSALLSTRKMSSVISPCPKIEVLYWDASRVRVRCPYCEGTHGHSSGHPGKRQSDCYPGGTYELCYPIDEKNQLVGFEIDKRRARFVNVKHLTELSNADRPPLDNDIHDLAHHMRILGLTDVEPDDNSSWKLRSDCVETCNTPGILEDTTMTQKRMPFAVSDCLCGDVAATRAYLATSEESELFLHGRDERGDTILIMTAREHHHSIVSLLIHHGADVNAVNGRGRSALMEAALWGRLENVKLLLEANVDKLTQDHEGRSALDLAQPTRANEKERYDQCEQAAAEKVPQWNQCRRHIAILLDSQSRNLQDYTAPLPANKLAEYYFEKSEVDRTIILRGPITKFNVQRISKTAAILDRGEQFPRISATSGWGKDALPVNIEYRPSWTKSVRTIATTAGHQLPAHEYDQGKKGQYYASHSEKKLIAYFIEKHVFTPQDYKHDKKLKQSLKDVTELLEETKTTSAAWKRVCALEASKDKLEWDVIDAQDELIDAGDGPQQADNRSKIDQMIARIQQLDKDRRDLEIEPDVLEMRHQQKKQRLFLEQERLEGCLMDMRQHRPVLSLTQAVIWSSNKVCGDCEGFTTAVNKHFGLNIELTWM